MRINDRLVQLKAVAFSADGFIQRHKRAPVATSVALLIAGPCSPAPAASRFPPTPHQYRADSRRLGHRCTGGAVDRPGPRTGARCGKRGRQCRSHCHGKQPTASTQRQRGSP